MMATIRYHLQLSPAISRHSSPLLDYCAIHRLLTGWTNSVSLFQHIMIKVLWLYPRLTSRRSDHRGRQETFEKIINRHQWMGMYEEVSNFVKYVSSEKRISTKSPSTLLDLVRFGRRLVVYMRVTSDGYGFILFVRDDLSGCQVEARALNNTSLEVGTFLYEEVICRHGLPQKFVMDNDPENQDITKSLLEHYNVKNVNISAYHP
jgi:hypothetical protein